jgi:hypothetical protein
MVRAFAIQSRKSSGRTPPPDALTLWGQFKSGAEDGAPVSVDRPALDGTPIIYPKLQKIRENRASAISRPHDSQATAVGSVSWSLLCIRQIAKW